LKSFVKIWAKAKVSDLKKPILAIGTKSKEPVINWLNENWVEIIKELKSKFSIIHLGDKNEPIYENVKRFAGKLTIRESAAILSKAKYFIGPDSLLMHVANGLNIKSTIIFGGSRPASCLGYPENKNLTNYPKCSPCWIHQGYEMCQHDMKCIKSISTHDVISTIYN